MKNAISSLVGIALCLWIALGSIVILTVFQEHVSSLISSITILVFRVVIFVFLGLFLGILFFLFLSKNKAIYKCVCVCVCVWPHQVACGILVP